MERAVRVIYKLIQSNQFKEHFVNWKQSWYFPRADETERVLKKARFRDIQISMSKRTTFFSNRDEFAIFVRTVIMKPLLGYIPDAKKKEQFLNAFLKEIEQSDWAWSLDYVRLGIFARK